jgi:hypothetical protein
MTAPARSPSAPGGADRVMEPSAPVKTLVLAMVSLLLVAY